MADRYSGTDFGPYMVQVQNSESIESHIGGTNTTLKLDGGNNTVYPINHTNLAYGNIYAATDTSNSVFGGAAVHMMSAQYQFSTNGTKLTVGLQNGIVAGDGNCTIWWWYF